MKTCNYCGLEGHQGHCGCGGGLVDGVCAYCNVIAAVAEGPGPIVPATWDMWIPKPGWNRPAKTVKYREPPGNDEEDIRRSVERMLTAENASYPRDYTPPTRMMNLTKCIAIAHEMYESADVESCSHVNFALVRRFIDDANRLLGMLPSFREDEEMRLELAKW